MLPNTREAFEAYCLQMRQVYGVGDLSKKFTVTPSTQQTLETKIQESSAFLSQINIYGVPELTGEKIGLSVNSTIAGRTNTSGSGRRQTQDPTGLDSNTYTLKKTNFDTHLGYDKLDVWAKFPDFQTRIQGAIIERCALDRIMIGWNGVAAAADTNRVTYPLLEDVNFGWLYHMRTDNAARVMDEGTKEDGKILIGEGGDYATLDSLIFDAKHVLLPSHMRKRTDLVAITGADLIHDKYFRLVDVDEKPTEQVARDIIMSSRRMGGLQAAEVPYFPDNAIMITPLKNLSIYYQDGKRRRHVREAPDADRVEDFQSSNEGYVIEDYEAACLLENIELIEA